MMNKPIISIENLGKKYRISSQQAGRSNYVALRDVLTDVSKSFIKRISHPFSGATVFGTSKEDFWALKEVSFDIQKGDRIGIIGRNGAGKSTILKILSRITEPTEGRVVIRGRVASLLEVGTGFHPELTGRENIYMNGSILGMHRSEIDAKFDEIVKFAEVEKFLDIPVKHFSSGMYVRLAFAVAAHLEPEILLVDEVLAVGDLNFRKKCLGKMQDISKDDARTVFFVSHDMSSIRQLCNKVILLSKGKIEKVGSADEVTAYYEKQSLEEFRQGKAFADRDHIPPHYHFSRVELRDMDGHLRKEYEAGESMEIHLFADREAPADSFTVEFLLFNEHGNRISFGAANPVRNTFYNKSDKHFVCKLGPLPMTSGSYNLAFSARVWGLERWDMWENAISFSIFKCDIYNTGFSVPSGSGGEFILGQEWGRG